MTQKHTPLLIAAGLVLATCGAGCSTSAGRPLAADQNRNLAGLIKIEPNSFSRTSPATVDLHTNELIEKPDSSGTKISLLWGWFTLEDY